MPYTSFGFFVVNAFRVFPTRRGGMASFHLFVHRSSTFFSSPVSNVLLPIWHCRVTELNVYK